VSLGHVRLGRIALPGAHYRIAGHGAAAASLVRSAFSPGGVGSLMRSMRWFLGTTQETMLRELVARDVPRAILWAESDTLIPLEVGKRAAEVMGCELHLIRPGDGWPGKRPPDHDWPFRQPQHFAQTVHDVLADLRGEKPQRKRRTARTKDETTR
ncbi:MAG TPA: hypothetical protein VM600_06715, partial [Actinomycetota bacterium]|nr:hypothetical protein [Actinomycetota bacterium]